MTRGGRPSSGACRAPSARPPTRPPTRALARSPWPSSAPPSRRATTMCRWKDGTMTARSSASSADFGSQGIPFPSSKAVTFNNSFYTSVVWWTRFWPAAAAASSEHVHGQQLEHGATALERAGVSLRKLECSPRKHTHTRSQKLDSPAPHTHSHSWDPLPPSRAHQ
eukprot:6186817-Pleurochrysis_carterae.AAC.3